MRRKVDIMSPSQDYVHLLTVGVWGGEEMRDIERSDSTKVTIMFRGKGSVREKTLWGERETKCKS